MSKVSVTVEVSKEMHELVQGLAEIVKAAKLALKDGFQPGADLPVVLVSAVSQLPAMVAGIDQLPAEAKAETSAFISAAVLGASDIVGAVLS